MKASALTTTSEVVRRRQILANSAKTRSKCQLSHARDRRGVVANPLIARPKMPARMKVGVGRRDPHEGAVGLQCKVQRKIGDRLTREGTWAEAARVSEISDDPARGKEIGAADRRGGIGVVTGTESGTGRESGSGRRTETGGGAGVPESPTGGAAGVQRTEAGGAAGVSVGTETGGITVLTGDDGVLLTGIETETDTGRKTETGSSHPPTGDQALPASDHHRPLTPKRKRQPRVWGASRTAASKTLLLPRAIHQTVTFLGAAETEEEGAPRSRSWSWWNPPCLRTRIS